MYYLGLFAGVEFDLVVQWINLSNYLVRSVPSVEKFFGQAYLSCRSVY